MTVTSGGLFKSTGYVNSTGKIRATFGALTADAIIEQIAGLSQLAATNPTNIGSTYVSMVAQGSNVILASDRNGTGISLARSADQGATWGAWTVPPLGGSDIPYLDQAFAAEGSKISLVTVDFLVQTINDFFGARAVGPVYNYVTSDGGATWSNRKRISEASARAFRVGHVISGNTIFVVWMDYRNNRWDLYCNWSVDAGVNWQATDTLLVQANAQQTTDKDGPQRPVAGIFGSNIYVAWMDNRDGNQDGVAGIAPLPASHEIYFKRGSISGGVITWQADQRLTNGPTAYSGRPYIDVTANGTIVIVYDKDAVAGEWLNTKIAGLRSTNGGVSFTDTIPLSTTGVGTHAVLINGVVTGRIYCAWGDTRPGTSVQHVYMRISEDGGLTWSDEGCLTTGATAAGIPTLGLSTNYVHVFFIQSTLQTRRYDRPLLP